MFLKEKQVLSHEIQKYSGGIVIINDYCNFFFFLPGNIYINTQMGEFVQYRTHEDKAGHRQVSFRMFIALKIRWMKSGVKMENKTGGSDRDCDNRGL